jgi:peptide/nickel transport system substrate-binding protein
MAPPYSWGSPDDLEPYPRDPGEARRLLQEAGSPQGRSPRAVPEGGSRGRSPRAATSGDVEPVARFLAESFEDSLGLEVEVVEIPEENLVAA